MLSALPLKYIPSPIVLYHKNKTRMLFHLNVQYVRCSLIVFLKSTIYILIIFQQMTLLDQKLPRTNPLIKDLLCFQNDNLIHDNLL